MLEFHVKNFEVVDVWYLLMSETKSGIILTPEGRFSHTISSKYAKI